MPFDPTKPANNAPNSSAEMRSQLTGLNDNINSVANGAASNLANAIAGTSSNSNGVNQLGTGASGGYDQQQMQDLINKVDELIAALRR
jgi:hypothetical protein